MKRKEDGSLNLHLKNGETAIPVAVAGNAAILPERLDIMKAMLEQMVQAGGNAGILSGQRIDGEIVIKPVDSK